jgi:hypothetical protein
MQFKRLRRHNFGYPYVVFSCLISVSQVNYKSMFILSYSCEFFTSFALSIDRFFDNINNVNLLGE